LRPLAGLNELQPQPQPADAVANLTLPDKYIFRRQKESLKAPPTRIKAERNNP
jgi:hypothetical protein